MTLVALLRKEFLEQWRTRRLWVLSAVFLFFGLLAPLAAKMTPELLKLASESAPGVIIEAPPPTVRDVVTQYTKNLAQILPLVVLLVAMGSVCGERERGTLPMVLAKPIARGRVLGAKFLALVVVLAVSLLLSAGAAYYYSLLLFGGPRLDSFLLLNLVASIYLLVVLSLTFLASTVAASTVMAGALAFGLWILLAVIGALPWVGRASPVTLLGWAAQLGLGQGSQAEWPALVASLAVIAGALAVAWLHFRRQEW